MTQRYDRRAFLRRLAAVGVEAPTVPMLGCGLEEIQRQSGEPDLVGLSITRPVLLPWTDGAVRITSPLAEPPLGYVARQSRRVYVDPSARDEIRGLLVAHISVSSGLWRIPLPGDDLAIPVDAGDERREFEETHVGEWDPTMPPGVGDFRVRRGRRENVQVDFDCVPMAGSEGRFSGGPWEIAQCGGQGDELCREDFTHIGTGSRYRRRALGTCAEPIGEVRYMTWASLD